MTRAKSKGAKGAKGARGAQGAHGAKTGRGGRAGAGRTDAPLPGPLAAAVKGAKTKRIGDSLLAQFPGRNNEKDLAARYGKVKRAAAAAGAELLGVQFFGIDEVAFEVP